MKVDFCDNRYTIDLLPTPGNQTLEGYIQYVITQYRRVNKNAICIEYCIKDIPKGVSVVEHFGGAGMLGVIVEKLLEPRSHLLFDIDPDCVQQLQHVFGDKAAYGDAKELMGKYEADYIALDFPYFTGFDLDEWPFEALFSVKPSYVTIADVTNRKLGLHRDYLSARLGQHIHTLEDYIRAISARMTKQYGYSVKKCAYHKDAFYLLTPEAPNGIEFLDMRGK